MTAIALILYITGMFSVAAICGFGIILGNGCRFHEFVWMVVACLLWPFIPAYIMVKLIFSKYFN
jgi:hypothetical protein